MGLFQIDGRVYQIFNHNNNMNPISLLLLLISVSLSSGKLAQVVSFFRHGSRFTITSLYDGNETRYTWGQLTSTGMRQHQTLGEMLKKQYMDKLGFLNSTYDSSEVQVYSTEVNRTIESVISQLYGLYPAGTGPKLLKVDPKYYLPPYHNKTNIDEKNFVFPNGHQIIPIKYDQKVMMDSCMHQQTWQQKNIQLQLDDYKEMNTTYWPFIKRMTSVFNLTGNVTLSTLASLNGVVDCDQYLARRIPSNFTADDQKNLRHIDSWYKQLVQSRDLAKAINRDRLNKIMGVFDGRVSNPAQKLKWTFLSGHDSDLCAMYTDLNLSSPQCIEQLFRKGQTSAINCEQYPEFAASLIFELYVEGSNQIIKIRSNGKYMNLCGQKSTECNYQDWKQRIIANLASVQLAQTICGKKTVMEKQKPGILIE